jgi:chromosome segregation ATPase
LTDRLAERDGTIKEQKQRFDLQVMALSREIELKKRENFNLSDAFDEEKMKAERYASGLRARIQCLEEDAGIVSPSERAFLEADITHAQTQCDKLREQVLKLQAQIAPHKIEIGELSSTIRQKEEEIAELKKRIFHLEERIKSMFELTRTFYDSSPFLR